MAVKNFDPCDMPPGMNDAWDWVCAIDAWDYCDPAPLAKLVASENIPADLRHVIAQIITGERRQKKKAAVKLKIPAADRMKVAGSVSAILGLVNTLKFDAIEDGCVGNGIVMLGDKKGLEPINIMRLLEGDATNTIKYAAQYFGVSSETIENLIRDLRKKIGDYPSL